MYLDVLNGDTNVRYEVISMHSPVHLPKEIKKSVAIVLIGNFLDFFDLLLAVHLTVVLSAIFIPPNSSSKVLLTTFMFCSSFCIRPLAALFWGYIGDTIGRVPVLISTTFLMSISCLIIPNIPPYAEWGILSAILFLFMRLVQGFASGGECIAADVFITETVPKPKVYFCSALVEATCSLGGLVACGIGALCLFLSPENGWKIPFYIGSGVAVLGTIARKTLKETPEFLKTLHSKIEKRKASDVYKTISYKNRNIPALFAMYFFPAVQFYFCLAYLPSVMINQLGISANYVMAQTTLVLFIIMCAEVGYGILGLRFHPFHIARFKLIAALFAILAMVFFYTQHTVLSIFIVQVIIGVLGQGLTPYAPIINKSFPVFGRYTNLLFVWAFSHSLMYLFTAYVCENVTSFYGLGALLFGSALISLIGLYTFIPNDKRDQLQENNDDTDFIETKQKVREVKKWLEKAI